jgi:hypothetical protein
MRGIQSVKKLFFKLSDFERVRSHGLHCYEPSAQQRDGTNDNLVPVNAVFPHEQKSLKSLVDSLEVWWGPNEMLGTAEGGTRHVLFAGVRHSPFCA